MPRPSAEDKLRRILAMVPWIAAHDGPTLEEVCTRFSLTPDELQGYLDLLFCCGLYPYSPDTLIEAYIDEDRVWIRYADYFARPMRFTPAEALALVAGGAALLDAPGTEVQDPLARGLAKLAAALGLDGDDVVDVDLADVEPSVMTALRAGAEAARLVEIDYYTYGRDERSTRTIEPRAVFNRAGHWYAQAWCRSSDAERLFRVDRVEAARLLDARFRRRKPQPLPPVFDPNDDDPLVVLDLPREAGWVAEQYPHEGVESSSGGGLRVRLRVSSTAWLERLLLTLGPDATVVEGPSSLRRDAARKVLARYLDEGATPRPIPSNRS